MTSGLSEGLTETTLTFNLCVTGLLWLTSWTCNEGNYTNHPKDYTGAVRHLEQAETRKKIAKSSIHCVFFSFQTSLMSHSGPSFFTKWEINWQTFFFLVQLTNHRHWWITQNNITTWRNFKIRVLHRTVQARILYIFKINRANLAWTPWGGWFSVSTDRENHQPLL